MSIQIQTNDPVIERDVCQTFLASQLPQSPASFLLYPPAEVNRGIHQRFEEQANLYPNQIAIKTPEWSITYRGLNERANQIAHAILAKFSSLPQQVAFVLPNDGTAIAVLLGILKAGKSYVPLDPLFPQDRLAYMLADSTAKVVLTDTANEALAKTLLADGTIVNLDTLDPTLPSTNPDIQVDPMSVAYILYTSGTTGQPKGIAFCHRNLLHTTMCLINSLRFSPTDALTQLHSTSFAASIVDIYCCLLSGAILYPWDVKSRGFLGLADWLRQEKVTALLWIPTPFRHFMDTLDVDEMLPEIRVVVMASEPLTTKEVDLHRQHFSKESILVNQMGTSESHNYHLYFVGHETPADSYIVPAGYSVSDDRTVLILDEEHQPLPQGERGEIAIFSPFMSLGYWNQDELTDEKFLPDAAGNPRQIYLTGDLGFIRDDGCLIHQGRKDFQVKVRGYRIEITEIEKTLSKAPGIRDAVVVAQDSPAGDKQLVAYVMPHGFSKLSMPDLKAFLESRLPEYMVPQIFVELQSFPTTATGKLDRMQLPNPSEAQSVIEVQDAILPRTETEQMLAGLWSKLLGTSHIGIHHNWFELGGHSLTAARLFVEIEKQTGKRLPMSTLFQSQTIAQQAQLIDKGSETISWSSLVPIQPNGSRPPLFLMHAHGGNVIGYYELVHYLGPDQPVYGLQAMGLDGESIVERSMAKMAAAYLAEIRTVQPHGPYHLAGFCFGGNTAFEIAQQLHHAGEQVAFLSMIESTHQAYPIYSSNASKWQRLGNKLFDRLKIEWNSATQDGIQSILPHLVARVARVRSAIQIKIERRLESIGAKIGIKIPQSQEYIQTRLEDIHDHAYYSQIVGQYKGDLLLLTAAHQPSGIASDPTLGWGNFIEGELTIQQFPGHRVGILDEPRVGPLARVFKHHLDAAHVKYGLGHRSVQRETEFFTNQVD